MGTLKYSQGIKKIVWTYGYQWGRGGLESLHKLLDTTYTTNKWLC